MTMSSSGEFDLVLDLVDDLDLVLDLVDDLDLDLGSRKSSGNSSSSISEIIARDNLQ